MTETITQITMEELKKMLTESFLSNEMKNAYAGVLANMNDEEKTQLVAIIEEGNKARTTYEADRYEQLAKLNSALEQHLKDALREEGKYARDQFEQMGGQEDSEEISTLEQQINNL
jgi:hypothetical protein